MVNDIRETLNEKNKTHGSFSRLCNLTHKIKDVLRDELRYKNDQLPPQHAEALDMIISKIGRIAIGDHDTTDHWLDIAGYATLVVDHLKLKKTRTQ